MVPDVAQRCAGARWKELDENYHLNLVPVKSVTSHLKMGQPIQGTISTTQSGFHNLIYFVR